MPRIKEFSPQFIDSITFEDAISADPILVEKVSDAIDKLDPESKRLIYEMFYQGQSLSSIACKEDIPLNEMAKRLYEIKRKLKIMLAGFVEERWGLRVKGVCRICGHPKEKDINNIILAKNSAESWGLICKKIESSTGEKFHPPQVLKAHIRHISSRHNGGNINAE